MATWPGAPHNHLLVVWVFPLRPRYPRVNNHIVLTIVRPCAPGSPLPLALTWDRSPTRNCHQEVAVATEGSAFLSTNHYPLTTAVPHGASSVNCTHTAERVGSSGHFALPFANVTFQSCAGVRFTPVAGD